ncbi:hypothetical protein BDV96DRAFT_599733 [Lophiotrema nucula]|uniref:F-box domain-containing protein n=1 Tax=Lophiotrema nucula TaxID=690887 RepID=A0A6A5Z7K1_9PLEO|nr:hypothetical protein BDV96DRAFT_599733 [Lophiotrema nucula]
MVSSALTEASNSVNGASVPPTASRLLDLIPEVFSRVCDYLGDKDLINIRQACRIANNKSYFTFGSRFFQSLEVCMHPLSLNEFLEISGHTELSKHVKKVVVYLKNVNKAYKKWSSGLDDSDNFAEGEEPQYFQDLLRLQQDMYIHFEDLTCLTESFKRLEGLDALRITDDDWNGFGTDAKLPFTRHPISCGIDKLLTPALDSWGILLESDPTRACHHVATAIQALEISGLTPHLTFDLWNIDQDQDDQMVHLFNSESMKRALPRLRVAVVKVDRELTWQIRLLEHSVHLRELKFFGVGPNVTQSALPLLNRYRWARLKVLMLSELSIASGPLIELLSTHNQSLQELEFSHSKIVGDSPIRVFDVIQALPKIRRLTLICVEADPVETITSDDFSRYEGCLGYDDEVLEVEGQQLTPSLSTLVKDYRTKHMWENTHFIDTRKARAVSEGYVVFDGITWSDTDAFKDLITQTD